MLLFWLVKIVLFGIGESVEEFGWKYGNRVDGNVCSVILGRGRLGSIFVEVYEILTKFYEVARYSEVLLISDNSIIAVGMLITVVPIFVHIYLAICIQILTILTKFYEVTVF